MALPPANYGNADPEQTCAQTKGTVPDNDSAGSTPTSLAPKASEELFLQLAEHLDSIFWVTDVLPERRVVYVSPGYQRLWGLNPQRLYDDYRVWGSMVHPDDLARTEQAFHERAMLGTFDEVYRIIVADGRVRWIRDRAFPVRNDAGEIYRLTGIAHDITDDKHAAQELERALETIRESEERYRRLAETASEGIWMINAAGETTYANAQLCTMLGYTEAEMQALKSFEVIFPEDVPLALEKFRRHELGNTERFDFRLRRKDGTAIWTHISNNPIFNEAGALIAILGMFTDITERKRAEEQLLFQAHLLEIVGQSVIATELDGTIIYWNRFAETLYGWSAEEARGQNVQLIAPAGPSQADAQAIMNALRAGQSWSGEFVVQHRDGRQFPVFVTNTPVYDNHQQLIGIIGMSTDISQRRQAEAERIELLAREQAARAEAELALKRMSRLQQVTATLAGAITPGQVVETVITQGMAVLGAEAGAINSLSDDGSTLEIIGAFGYSQHIVDSWRRYPISTSIPASEAVRLRAPIWVESHDKLVRSYPALVDVQAETGFGAVIALPLTQGERVLGSLAVQFAGDRQFSEHDQLFLMNLADLCAQALERARLYESERRARAEAQEAVRVRDAFLSVAAHELKNPLTSLFGQAQLLQRRLVGSPGVGEREHHSLSTVLSQAERINDMIDGLLDISRLETGQLTIHVMPFNLLTLMWRVIEGIQPVLEEHTLVLDCPEKPIMLSGDELRLEQVLQNLLSNAVKYSPYGGTITVRVVPQNDYVSIEVTDQGIGIPADALPNLFRRFFRANTQEVQGIDGIGVGLYVVKEIVALHGGEVQVTSIEGQGSTFTISLPLLRT